MRSTFWRTAFVTLLVSAVLGAATGGAGAAPAARTARSAPATPPAVSVDGTDWSCRPSAAHPHPVVMLHGLGGSGDGSWDFLAPRLVAAGYCVFTLTYGQVSPGSSIGGLRPIAESAREVTDFIGRVRNATGAARVDVVGHSEGGFLGLYIPKVLGQSHQIGTVVALAPPTRGTTVNGLVEFAELIGARALLEHLLRTFGCDACADALPGSAVVTALGTGPIAQPGVRYTIVATRFDRVVTPPDSAFVREPGVRNLFVQDVCPFDPVGHVGLALDPGVADIVGNALDPAGARPVRCGVGPPF